MTYCILPGGGLGVLSTILEVGLTSPSWTGRLAGTTTSGCPVTEVETAPIARVPSAGPLGRQNHPTCPPDNGSQRGVHLGPGSPGCTCQGIKAPCDGLSVCPPVLPVLAVQPVTPCCRDPREETGPRESGVRSGRRDAVRETDRQTVDEFSVRKGPERRGDMRHSKVQYLHSPHVRHLHLTSANAWKDQFENLNSLS